MSDPIPAPPEYQFRKTLLKFAKHLGITLGSVAMWAAIAALADQQSLGQLLKDIPHSAAFVPAIAGLAGALINWHKHKDVGKE